MCIRSFGVKSSQNASNGGQPTGLSGMTEHIMEQDRQPGDSNTKEKESAMNTYTSKRADRMPMNLRQTIYLLAAILRRQNEMVKRQTGNVN